MKGIILSIAALLLIVSGTLPAQERHDRAVFEVKTDVMKDSIKARLHIAPPADKPRKGMQMDFSGIQAPSAITAFTSVWHFPPIQQGLSGMCWCFSTTSMLESEIYRLSHRKIKLSELHTIYWEYVEKARAFVETRGKTHIGEGSEANAVLRIWKKYGVVPEELYTGLSDGAVYHDHEHTLFPEIRAYLESVKERNAWNTDEVISTVRSILDHYIGAPPATVMVEGKQMTPREYLAKVVMLNPDDYVDFMSLMEKPYYAKAEYEVPDNWWHSDAYYNIPLNDFMRILREAIQRGYSLAIGGDFTEPGYSYGEAGIAVVPSFDIPASAINEEARQFRFSNGTTTDDHGLHLVGYVEQDGKYWYLIKDSWSTAYNSEHPGYYFYHEDYVKLKIMGFTVHKDVAKEILAKCR
jgi:bleomycin hydrolase